MTITIVTLKRLTGVSAGSKQDVVLRDDLQLVVGDVIRGVLGDDEVTAVVEYTSVDVVEAREVQLRTVIQSLNEALDREQERTRGERARYGRLRAAVAQGLTIPL